MELTIRTYEDNGRLCAMVDCPGWAPSGRGHTMAECLADLGRQIDMLKPEQADAIQDPIVVEFDGHRFEIATAAAVHLQEKYPHIEVRPEIAGMLRDSRFWKRLQAGNWFFRITIELARRNARAAGGDTRAEVEAMSEVAQARVQAVRSSPQSQPDLAAEFERKRQADQFRRAWGLPAAREAARV